MAKKHTRFQDTVNGRISLLFFYLLAFAGVLWTERFARYRYDYIFRPMLPWLLPILFGITAVFFIILFSKWHKGGKQDSGGLFSVSFLMLLPLPLMAGFLLPWLTLFGNGLQFFRLATELVFYATLGGFAGYIGYYKSHPAAAVMAGATTLNCLALFYFYDRFLSPTAFILNSGNTGLGAQTVALILAGLVVLATLAALLFNRKPRFYTRPFAFMLPSAFTLILLAVTAATISTLNVVIVRWLIFGGMGSMLLWYILWCVLKKKKML